MKTLFRNSLAVALTLALAAGQITASAQNSRRSSTSGETSTTTTSSRSSATTTGTSTSSSRSSATTPTSQVNTGSSRSSATTAGTSTSSSRSSATTPTSQVNTGSSRSSSATTGTSTSSSRSSATTPTSQVNTGSSRSGSATTGTSTSSSRSSAVTGSEATRPTTSATQSTTTSRSGATTSGNVTGTSRSSATTQGTAATTSRSSASTTQGTTATTSRASLSQTTTATSNTTARRSNSSSSVTSKGLTAVSSTRSTTATSGKPENMKGTQVNIIMIDNSHNVVRIPPRQRDFVTYDRPCSFYGTDPHHFGYRVEYLPRKYKRASHWGIDYYYYNDVYYRYYNNHYVVCRPPIGITWKPRTRNFVFPVVQFAYYHTTYHPMSVTEMYWRTINRQNEIIAQNNAILARQYADLALNSSRALSAREIANQLGLVQSYAHINDEYYYQDGVFFSYLSNGRYEVIVPPAGALVGELPDDYDIIVLNGVEYYKVDDTVYRLTLVDGTPLLEVLGQMYGSMATRYNYYF